MSLQWPPKDKDETLDFSLDWTRALEPNETIVSVVWRVVDENGNKTLLPSGATVYDLTNIVETTTNTVATVYLSGGVNNRQYKLFCSITTNQDRTKERAVTLKIREYN